MKLLIVEDEAPARERLGRLVLELYPEAGLYEAADGLEALAELPRRRPEIVLLDIRMPGMDGLEFARHALTLEQPPAIVFTTAWRDHALAAFEANAVDYLLKPVRRERLRTAIERARVVSEAQLMAVERRGRKHLSAMFRGRLQLVAIKDIRYFKAEQKYVTAAWPGGEILVDESLAALQEEFPDRFVRVHRNALVAKAHIAGLSKTDAGQTVIRLQDMPVALDVSRRHLAAVRALLTRL